MAACNHPPAMQLNSGGGGGERDGAAAAELPDSTAEALWDRFLLRVAVPPLPLRERTALLTATAIGNVRRGPDRCGRRDYRPTTARFGGARVSAVMASEVVSEVARPPQLEPQQLERLRLEGGARRLLLDLAAELATTTTGAGASSAPPSDRRLVRSARLLRVAAYSSGRARVTEVDCLLLPYVLARPEEAEFAAEWVAERL